MRARKLLAKHETGVLDEIERQKEYAAYGLGIDNTHRITRKSSAVARATIAQRLKQSLQDELSALKFRHVEVELKGAGGREGIL